MPEAALAGTSRAMQQAHGGEGDCAGEGHAEHQRNSVTVRWTPPKAMLSALRMATMMMPKACAVMHFASR